MLEAESAATSHLPPPPLPPLPPPSPEALSPARPTRPPPLPWAANASGSDAAGRPRDSLAVLESQRRGRSTPSDRRQLRRGRRQRERRLPLAVTALVAVLWLLTASGARGTRGGLPSTVAAAAATAGAAAARAATTNRAVHLRIHHRSRLPPLLLPAFGAAKRVRASARRAIDDGGGDGVGRNAGRRLQNAVGAELAPSTEEYEDGLTDGGRHQLVVCQASHFPCGNSTTCIARELHCNGEEDCANGEDEKGCSDISKGIISVGHVVKFDWKTQSTRMQTEYEGSSTQIPTCGPFIDLPDGCFCKNENLFQFVRCTSVEANARLFKNASYPLVTRLVIQDSYLGVLTPDTLAGFTNITILYLNNSVSGITPDAFEKQERLRQLYITNNTFLTTLQLGVFSGLGRLNVLRITGNRLDTFDFNHLSYMPQLGALSLLNNGIEVLPSTAPLHSLRLLDLKHNKIERIDQTTLARLTRLEVLNLRHNRIKMLHPDVFQHNARLVELDLSSNELTYLPSEIFRKLRSLSTLSLANNPITYLHVNIFVHSRNLSSLNLSGLELENIDVAHFHQLRNLKFIYLKKFQYCSYAPYVRICQPKTDGVSSTEHLLVWPVLRLAVWIVAVSTCAANSVVFTWRVISHKEDRVLSLFIKNLSIADFLMGVYLIIVGTLDVAFRDEYNRHARQWMTSWRCTAVGLLAMMSCEVSVLILSLITIERYRCIKTNVRVVTVAAARWCVAAVWATGAALALYPLLHWPQPSFYSSNGLCFPLHIDDPFTLGWQYSALVFLGINLAAMILISLLYAWMFVIIRGDRQHARPVTVKRREDSVLAFRFFLIVLTDCLCWIPIITIKLAALCNVKISPDIYAWVVVFILPINSALNPVIYTLAAPTELRRRIERLLGRATLCPVFVRRYLPNAYKFGTPRSSLATGTDVPSIPTEYTLCNETAKL